MCLFSCLCDSNSSNLYFRKCEKCVSLRKRLVCKSQRLKRTLHREKSLKSLLRSLKTKMLNHDSYTILKKSFSGLTLSMLENEIKNHDRKAPGRRYSDDIAKFAITLHFYSPAAYEFVRSVLNLPHASTLREWSSSVSAQPGILKQVFEVVGQLVQKDRSVAECALISDEMSIRKSSDWDPQK